MCDVALKPAVARLVILGAVKDIGEVLLGRDGVRVVVRVLVSHGMAQFLGAGVVSVSQVFGHGPDLAGLYVSYRRVDGVVRAVRFGCGGNMHHSLRERVLGFRHA